VLVQAALAGQAHAFPTAAVEAASPPVRKCSALVAQSPAVGTSNCFTRGCVSMPMFNFQIESAGAAPDIHRLMLQDARAAQGHAQTLDSAVALRDRSARRNWTITVTDEHANVVYAIRREL